MYSLCVQVVCASIKMYVLVVYVRSMYKIYVLVSRCMY